MQWTQTRIAHYTYPFFVFYEHSFGPRPRIRIEHTLERLTRAANHNPKTSKSETKVSTGNGIACTLSISQNCSPTIVSSILENNENHIVNKTSSQLFLLKNIVD